MTDATVSKTEIECAIQGWRTFRHYARWIWLSECDGWIKNGKFDFSDQDAGFGGSDRVDTLRDLAASFTDGLNEDLLADLTEVALFEELADWNAGLKPLTIYSASDTADMVRSGVMHFYLRSDNSDLVGRRLAQKNGLLAALIEAGFMRVSDHAR